MSYGFITSGAGVGYGDRGLFDGKYYIVVSVLMVVNNFVEVLFDCEKLTLFLLMSKPSAVLWTTLTVSFAVKPRNGLSRNPLSVVLRTSPSGSNAKNDTQITYGFVKESLRLSMYV